MAVSVLADKRRESERERDSYFSVDGRDGISQQHLRRARMDGWMNVCVFGWMDIQMDGRFGADRRMNGQTDRQIDGWKNSWKAECMH